MTDSPDVSAARLWRGHFRTLRARVRRAVRPEEAPPSVPWETVLDDPDVGPVRLTGHLSRPPGASAAVVLVHGLGGCADSGYMPRAALAARAAGLASLRLNLRGSDRRGEDYYHAGLTADLRAAVSSPELAAFDTVYLLGYSMGGHLTLRYATENGALRDPRVEAVAAVCAPLDLASSGRVMDRPAFWIYRRYLFANLMEIYRAVAARRPVPIPVEEAERIRTFREWDDRIVAPRHGFADAEDYYARASVAPRLDRFGGRAPRSLLVVAEDDPMVPAATVRPALEGRETGLRVCWVPSGGHIAFSERLEPRVLRWLTGDMG